MKSNRLLPHQFGAGNTADGTRIEQALATLVSLYNDVPPSLIQRRWSPSHMVWGLTPSSAAAAAQFMNTDNTAGPSITPTNPQRVKSNAVFVNTSNPAGYYDGFLNMEVTFSTSSPVIIGSAGVLAELQPAGPYNNEWLFGATPPTGYTPAQASHEFTFQVCVSDGWDMENRKKLRQESLVYNLPASAFKFSPASTAAVVDTLVPAHPEGVFNGYAITPMPLILVPGGARVVFQWTIPKPLAAGVSSFFTKPTQRNVWNLFAQVWRPTR